MSPAHVERCRRLLAAAAIVTGVAGADWPAFRGPHGLGASGDHGFPVRWGAAENIVWKRQLPGPGASSPVLCAGRVFITCYSGYGLAPGGDPAKLRRHLLCLDRHTGAVLWERTVAAAQPEVRYHGFITEHGYASSTPAADGERVYVFFGKSGVLAFDFEGKQLWQASVGTALNGWGSGASPVLYRGLVLVNATVESGSLVALDRLTGKEAWRARNLLDTWSTPCLVDAPGGKQEVVLNTPGTVLGFDPETGRKLWECEGIDASAATSTPVARDGTVYVMGAGARGRATLAIRAGGRGDVSKTHVRWRQKAGAGICSPVLYGGHLYWVSGQAGCLRADTGEVLFQERLYETRQEYASAVAADGKLFAFTRRNGGFVLGATGRFERLAHNDLGDAAHFNASPALGDGQIVVRSDAYVYCIGIRK